MEERNIAMARRVAQAVAQAGGRTFFVGGFVRDRLRGMPGKDVDIEVHGVTPEALRSMLNDLGECVTKGASFGVFGLRHYELDIAMPRRESATGRGHKDFAVFVDPFLGLQGAAQRRDFTVNALMEDVCTGEVVDLFGGREDLRRGILRAVKAATFVEDPLRVLRAAQFAARFDWTIAPETRALCASMDLSALTPERVMGELSKALLKAQRPSVFFEQLRDMKQLDGWFPELAALIGVEQDPVHHPEGDAFVHTMRVLDAAAQLRPEASEPLALMISALCHDLGKAVTTQRIDGRIHAYGHETKGLPLAERLVTRLTKETRLLKTALNMTALHMRPNMLTAQNAGEKAYMKLFDQSVNPRDLLLLAKADHRGKTNFSDDTQACALLESMLARYEARLAQPGVDGLDLIAAGFAPGPRFKEALAFAHRLQIIGVSREEALRQTLASLGRPGHGRGGKEREGVRDGTDHSV
jgi:tRNA nucleotidyltransferase (CCA-adding enzyme)